MKEIEICKCCKASMTYDVIGEDLWSAIAKNTELKRKGHGVFCICKNCNEIYSSYDPVMVKIFNIEEE